MEDCRAQRIIIIIIIIIIDEFMTIGQSRFTTKQIS